jgi:C_GCAxxG_C_C family probable redox protein
MDASECVREHENLTAYGRRAGIEKSANKAYALAYEYEQKYGYCAQCVVAALQDTLDFISDDVVRSAHALSGGLGGAGDGTCGALAGGVMAICCKYGRERKDFDRTQMKLPEELAKRLHDLFIEEYGSPICGDVQRRIFGRSFNIWDPSEYQEFESAGAHIDKCPKVVGKVAKWVTEILLEEESRLGSSSRG